MHKLRRRRLFSLLCILLAVGLSVALALYALRRDISLYYTPNQLVSAKVPLGQRFRLGGMVLRGSVHHGRGLFVRFTLTDFLKTQAVDYTGVLPSLFREGQGIVAEGQLTASGIFLADTVLAKHDEKYRPPLIPSEKSTHSPSRGKR